MASTANTRTARGGSPQRPRNVAPVIATLVCVALFSFLSGGYILTRSAPIAIVFLLLAAVWVWFLRRRAWPPPLLLAALVAMAGFTGWVGLSTLWSIGPDLSWVAFDLAAFYLAVLAVVGLTPIRRLQLRLAGWGFLAVATAVAVYAFLGKGLPDVVRTANTNARLDSPIGYWNVLALVMVMGLVVAARRWPADRAVPPVARAWSPRAGVPMAFTFFFTFSRGGWIALAVALLRVLRAGAHAAGELRHPRGGDRSRGPGAAGGCATSTRCSPPPRTRPSARLRATRYCAGPWPRCWSRRGSRWPWRWRRAPCPGRAGRGRWPARSWWWCSWPASPARAGASWRRAAA